MHVADTLLKKSFEDTILLAKNDKLGDDSWIPRDVNFLFFAEDMIKAESLACFIQDNQYANTRIEETDGDFLVIATVVMPTTQNIVCSVSALMTCISGFFSVQYDGWNCILQK